MYDEVTGNFKFFVPKHHLGIQHLRYTFADINIYGDI